MTRSESSTPPAFFIRRNDGMRNSQLRSASHEIPETPPKQVVSLTPGLILWFRYKLIVQVRTGSSGENSQFEELKCTLVARVCIGSPVDYW